MKLPIHISPEVLKELSEASGWYEQQQEGLGEELIDEFFFELDYVRTFPGGFPVSDKKRKLRRLLLKRFPYLVIFSIENETIYVGRFVHAKQHPRTRIPKGYK